MGDIFVVAACTAGKGRQGRLFMGKIFVVRPPTTKTTNILPHENYTLYGNCSTLSLILAVYECKSTFQGIVRI